jgi:hypothetical protein
MIVALTYIVEGIVDEQGWHNEPEQLAFDLSHQHSPYVTRREKEDVER